jgi:hypothetical protein
MKKDCVIINSIRHASTIRNKIYFNEIVKQCAKELDILPFTIPSLSGVEWNAIKDLSNKAKDPADLMNEVKVMFHL